MRFSSFLASFSLLCIPISSLAIDKTDTFTFLDFTDVSRLKLNGSALSSISARKDQGALRLTNGLNQGSSAFMKRRIKIDENASFSSSFTLRMSHPMGRVDKDGIQGADGIVFVIQNVANNVGSTGGGLGYKGIPRSVGVEFDSWYNDTYGDIDGNHVGINIGGKIHSVVSRSAPFTLNDGREYYAWVDYEGKSNILEVRISRTEERPEQPFLAYTVDLRRQLRSDHIYVGFTSGTGASGNWQSVINWRFDGRYDPQSTVIDKHTIGAACARANFASNDPLLESKDNSLRPDLLEGLDSQMEMVRDCFARGGNSNENESGGSGGNNEDGSGNTENAGEIYGGKEFAANALNELANKGIDDGSSAFGLSDGSILHAAASGIGAAKLLSGADKEKMNPIIRKALERAEGDLLKYGSAHGVINLSTDTGNRRNSGPQIIKFGKEKVEALVEAPVEDSNLNSRNPASQLGREKTIFDLVSNKYKERSPSMRGIDSYLIELEKSRANSFDSIFK